MKLVPLEWNVEALWTCVGWQFQIVHARKLSDPNYVSAEEARAAGLAFARRHGLVVEEP
ncbi:MAG: hypothetical protein V2A79_06485 [Planctomycetota bacterium]